MLKKDNKNYRYLVDLAEGAYLKEEYLEAFLIQSCVFEGVVKNYASQKLQFEIEQSPILKNKLDNYEFAKIIDVPFIAGKISKKLFESLNTYRNTRNGVVHDLLKREDKNTLKNELKAAYEAGKSMKGFIVDDMDNEIQPGVTVAELQAQIAALLGQITKLQSELASFPGAHELEIQIADLTGQLAKLEADKINDSKRPGPTSQ